MDWLQVSGDFPKCPRYSSSKILLTNFAGREVLTFHLCLYYSPLAPQRLEPPRHQEGSSSMLPTRSKTSPATSGPCSGSPSIWQPVGSEPSGRCPTERGIDAPKCGGKVLSPHTYMYNPLIICFSPCLFVVFDSW